MPKNRKPMAGGFDSPAKRPFAPLEMKAQVAENPCFGLHSKMCLLTPQESSSIGSVRRKFAESPGAVTIALHGTEVFSSTKSKTNPKPSLVMKPIIPFALLGALLAVGAADAAATQPVGYYNFAAVSGGNLFVPSLVNPAAFTGVLTADAPTTLTVAANSFTANAFNEGATFAKFYVEITSGPNTGVNVDIVSNTTDTLTLDADVSALGLVGTESIVVRPHVTLKSSLAAAEASLVGFNDLATFYLPNGTNVSYVFGAGATPNGWSSDFATDDGSDRPVYPGTGFVLGVSANVDLTVTGEVKTADSVVQLTGGVVNIVGPLNPLVGASTSLNLTGFGTLGAFSDTITVYVAGPLVSSVSYTPLGDGTISSDFTNPTTDTIANTTGAVVIPDANKSLVLESNVTIAP
jgi:hypothetical protein